ncbi:MAG: hypothetical protein HOC71_11470 [Candidatus Latescibacteria bacterium]|jgi:hypothetical protein|nr:hypothetical protein [Candidatus Latescibacterota bacterium]
MTSMFEENEQILDDLEQAEHSLEKIRIDGHSNVEKDGKRELAGRIKQLVTSLVENIASSGGDVERLGGAVVLADLADVLERYEVVFNIPDLRNRLEELRGMIEEAGI